jgi:hypothetical protein
MTQKIKYLRSFYVPNLLGILSPFILKHFFVDTVVDMISSMWMEKVGDKPGIEPVGCDYKRLIKRI